MIIPQLKLMGVNPEGVEQGVALIEQDMPGTSVFVMERGKVAVTIDGTEIAVVDKRGAIFGEMSALLGKSRGATVTTMADSTFYVIDDLLTFLRQNPEMSLLLLKTMAERVDRSNSQLAEKRKWWQLF